MYIHIVVMIYELANYGKAEMDDHCACHGWRASQRCAATVHGVSHFVCVAISRRDGVNVSDLGSVLLSLYSCRRSDWSLTSCIAPTVICIRS